MKSGNGEYIHVLVKFGRREHMEALRRGELRMAPLVEYRAMEADQQRHDPLEGLFYQSTQVTVTLGGVTISPGEYVGPVRIAYDNGPLVFCMWSIQGRHVQAHLEGKTPLVHPSVKQFGNSAALIIKGGEFMKRVTSALRGAGHGIDRGPVRYIDLDAHEGRVDPFAKDLEFAHQNEYRIATREIGTEAKFFRVEDMSDIIVVVPTEQLLAELRIQVNSTDGT